jgi:hypothetical protein
MESQSPNRTLVVPAQQLRLLKKPQKDLIVFFMLNVLKGSANS